MPRPLFEAPPPAPDPLIAACPAGPNVDVAEGKWGTATASFSADRVYRFRLSRVWDFAGPRINFLMLNPSTADAFKLDPTVRRCMGFALKWGFTQVEVTNCFALRSTRPALLRTTDEPIGSGNDQAILAAATAADFVVAAWGVHAAYLEREDAVRELLGSAGVALHCLRITKDGHPGHPLYVSSGAVPERWEK